MPERHEPFHEKESSMSKGKGGGFKGPKAKSGGFAEVAHSQQARRPPPAPVMRIAPRAKSGAKGR